MAGTVSPAAHQAEAVRGPPRGSSQGREQGQWQGQGPGAVHCQACDGHARRQRQAGQQRLL